jgi:B3 DNA binding domain
VCENVELKCPSGITWHVKMIKSNGNFIFQSGWRDFIIANKIEKNDILVFKYSGNSSFEVIIFDPSGCQKAAPFFAKKMETQLCLQESSDSSIQVVAEHPREIKKDCINITSGSNESSNEISSDNEVNSEAILQKRKKGTHWLPAVIFNYTMTIIMISGY